MGELTFQNQFRCKELEVRLQSVEKEASAYADRHAPIPLKFACGWSHFIF